MADKYTLKELSDLPTLHVGQTDDLKKEFFDENDVHTRVWLSRLTVEDGVDYNNAVFVEKFNGDKWITVEEYEAK